MGISEATFYECQTLSGVSRTMFSKS